MSATGTACHELSVDHPSASLPWGDDPRGDDKTRLLKYVRENNYGVPVVNAVRVVVNPDTEAGDADHRLALRFYRDHRTCSKPTDVTASCGSNPARRDFT